MVISELDRIAGDDHEARYMARAAQADSAPGLLFADYPRHDARRPRRPWRGLEDAKPRAGAVAVGRLAGLSDCCSCQANRTESGGTLGNHAGTVVGGQVHFTASGEA
jgi:hypothetical protein